MRRLLVLIFAISLFGCAKKNEEAKKLLEAYSWVGTPDSLGQIVVLKGHAYGLVDTNAVVLAEPVYSMIGPYVQSVRRVQKGWATGEYYSEAVDPVKEGAIDSLGKVIVPAKYDAVDGFWRSDDFTLVALDGKVGVYRIDGKKVASPTYDRVGGIVARWVEWRDVPKSKKKRRGRQKASEGESQDAPPPLFDEYGLIEVVRDDLHGWLDSSGTERIAPKYDDLKPPGYQVDSTVWYKSGDKWGLVNLNGKELTPPIYDEYNSWKGTHCIVRIGRHYGIVNTRGRETQPVVYSSIEFLTSSFCAIQREETNSLEGLAAVASSKVYIEPMYREIIRPHGDDRFVAQSADSFKYGVINPANRTLVPFEYDDIRWGTDGSFAYYSVRSDRLWGFLSPKAKPLGELQWNDISSFSNGLARVSNSSVGYLMNYTGKLKEVSRRR